MRNRKAFTLIELLVVIGVITLLIGLLLPMLFKASRSAQITQQKADFQTISSALENYKNDFGDYPRNIQLPIWNTQNIPANATPGPNGWPAPVYLTLASALMGPGPGATQLTQSNVYEIGDGADGLGFRSQTVNLPITVTTPVISTTVTYGAISPAYQNQFNAFISTFVPGQTVAMLTLSAGTSYEETVGISGVSTTTLTISPPIYTTAPQHLLTDAYVLKIATGKIWPSYLPADTFKIAFLPNTQVNFQYGEPVLLDRWGQVIQYFPQYGPASNRTNDSMYPPYNSSGVNTAVTAGPLYGYSQPKSIDGTYGQNAMWDSRDGAPFFNTSSQVVVQPWPAPQSITPAAAPYFDPSQAILWMLGNQTPNSTNTGFTGVIAPPVSSAPADKLNYSGPYILISAGPDGPYRANGGFCNLLNPTSGQLLGQNQWQSTFLSSGNIYNFDHP